MSTDNSIKRKMYVEHPIKVKAYDTDFMQIVNNTVYVRWFEDLRTEMLDKYFPQEDVVNGSNSPILAETNIKYKRPITLKSKPIGKAWIEELEKSKWVACFEIVENDVIYCEGRQTGYYFSMEKMKPVSWPEKFLEFYDNL